MYTQQQFDVMNALDGKTVKDTITGFVGKVAGFCVYPEYEGKYVSCFVTCNSSTGDLIEKWIWNTRLEVVD